MLTDLGVLVPPRFRSPKVHTATRGTRKIEWCEQHMQTLKGPWAGRPLRFLEWEKLVIQELFEGDEAGNRYRQGLVGVGRQNGKSIIGSGLAVEALFRGPVGSEIYSAAGDRQQARVVFGEAKRQIASTPRLAAQAKVYRDAIEIPSTGSVYRVLSSDAKLQQGLSPYFVVFDEVHVQRDDELWNAMAFGMAARPGSVLLGITTAGDHEDSLCGRLYEYGRLIASGEVDDPSFFFMWWEPAEENVDIFDRDGWRQANPALLEGVLNEEELEQSARRSSPAAFRRYRLNQWVSHGGDRWMDMQAWDECVDEDLTLKTGDPIVLAFDGSVDEDATALAAFRLDKDVPRLAKLWVWERQPTDPDTWQVDRLDVDAVVRECFAEYRVKAMGCDPAYWRSEIQEWQVQFGRKVLEWPVTNARMGPACTEVYKRVKDGDFAHNGDPTLRRHVRNAITKPTPGGHVTIRKQTPKSEHKIDAAVTVCIGVDLWTRYATGSRVLRTF